jgi:hypothetical protein
LRGPPAVSVLAAQSSADEYGILPSGPATRFAVGADESLDSGREAKAGTRPATAPNPAVLSAPGFIFCSCVCAQEGRGGGAKVSTSRSAVLKGLGRGLHIAVRPSKVSWS